MESFFQYQRIKQAVRDQLAETKEKCSCEGYALGSPHSSSCQLCDVPFSDPPNKFSLQETLPTESLIIVDWDSPNDPLNPANQSVSRKMFMTLLVSLIAFSVTAASAIDACGIRQYSEEFNVSEVVGSLATALFLVGFGVGSLLSGPFSETFGRNAVYLTTMILFLIFIMAAALAPNIHSHLIFRFFAGFFGSTPLTCAGGTVADLWDPLQKTYAFPAYAIPSFLGPMAGQIIGSYIPIHLGWRWLEWIMLIMGGATLVVILLFQPETYGPLLLYWKAKILREETGDKRYKAPMEMKHATLSRRLLLSVYRPFVLVYSELIIILMSLYLTVLYIVLFTFLEGYTYIFGQTYGLSQEITGILWAGMLCGILLVGSLVPVVYSWTAKEYKKTSTIAPEIRLWYAMLGGAPAVPISLFWMGWTSYPSISIWSPIIASALFGYGITSIFIVTYMYIIDSYGGYSASALGFLVFTRYVVAGGMTVAGGPIYRSIGVHYTLTILGAISTVMATIPYLLFVYGPTLRKYSKYAVNIGAE
ncbi:Major facilitator superfamily domain, general substrate transporter [Penicillium expansum]|uniref:Major facilitator superfamily domain, general substrate transporter n=1 Tax=Penicillium expansum TaxID=27334 RepID=A0A0A2IYV7_PENEN|nr:Major facilitator superfamily domain, general substrate transporter [Penicillium expansum]KGO47701.1 Major facilitator superfamily domain, general substrate transporter [Penicillium expansum]KGO52011.1 Major facilitator superfamily domain, general substrate transporter [Penicillium expansum]KGO52933.1 Major facilitator superfamily domain, general substrate transporter [Penicillium expansum]